MRHGHSEATQVSDRVLIWAFAINQLLTVAQVAAGLISGSLALIADALHNFNDAMSLLVAYIARRVARRQPNERYTFGYRRAELIGAVINLTALGMVGLYLVYQAVERFLNPVEIVGWLMIAAAGLTFAVDAGTAWLLWSMSRGNLNARAAFVHKITDSLGSIAVLLGGLAVIYLKWYIVDPIVTLLIAGYALYQSVTMLKNVIPILMESAPPELNVDQITDAMKLLGTVHEVHHVHVWQLDEHHRALEAHVVIDRAMADDFDEVKRRLKQVLRDDFGIEHSTIEIEFLGEDLSPTDHAYEHRD